MPWRCQNAQHAIAQPSLQTRVAAGDLNGDGKANATTQSDVTSPKDSSTGIATGKHQHQPISVTKDVGATSLLK